MCLNSPSHGLALLKAGAKLRKLFGMSKLFCRKTCFICRKNIENTIFCLNKLKFLPVFLSITYLMCIFASVLGNLINESFKNIRE